MLTIDPFEGKEKNEAVGFIDFLEALCRVADCLSLCTEDELAELQDKPKDEDEESDQEEEIERKTWFHLYKASLAGGTPLPRRKSTGFLAENTRPVEGKVGSFVHCRVMKDRGRLSQGPGVCDRYCSQYSKFNRKSQPAECLSHLHASSLIS